MTEIDQDQARVIRPEGACHTVTHFHRTGRGILNGVLHRPAHRPHAQSGVVPLARQEFRRLARNLQIKPDCFQSSRFDPIKPAPS